MKHIYINILEVCQNLFKKKQKHHFDSRVDGLTITEK